MRNQPLGVGERGKKVSESRNVEKDREKSAESTSHLQDLIRTLEGVKA